MIYRNLISHYIENFNISAGDTIRHDISISNRYFRYIDTALLFTKGRRSVYQRTISEKAEVFIYLDEDAFVMLYKSLVRSHLEYATSVWNLHRLGLIKDLEKVQMRATKLVINIFFYL